MNAYRLAALATLSLAACGLASAADRIVVTVSNPSALARPAEVIAVPFDDIKAIFPNMMMDHLAVRDASGAILPSQGTNFDPREHHDYYLDLLFQHDFAEGETEATFTIEETAYPVPPFPSKVFARYIPERFDDFAWENDKVAHRAYGPTLNTPTAGQSQMNSSGIDIWCKRVPYLIVDRWYNKGHYHDDSGEGLDMYDVGRNRGCGGTGIWNGESLAVPNHWASWKVLENGPIQAVFELGYAPWDAGDGVMVSETKRFYVNAGHNLDRVESTFTFEGPKQLTVGIGVTTHEKKASVVENTSTDMRWTSLWETFNVEEHGILGTAIVLDPAEKLEGFAANKVDRLVLASATSGKPVVYYAGAGWSKAGEITSQAKWEAYLDAWQARLRNPVSIKIEGR